MSENAGFELSVHANTIGRSRIMANQPVGIPLKEQLIALSHLQEVDLKITNAEKKKADFPNQLKIIGAKLTQAKAAHDKKFAEISEHEKALRQVNAALELNQDRSQRAGEKTTSVQNQTEYAAVNREVEQLKRQETSLGEQKSKISADIDLGQKALAQLGEQLQTIQAEYDRMNQDLGSAAKSIDDEIAILDKDREQFTHKVDRGTLSQYDRVRKARGGQGLAPAVNGRCTACNMMLPPQMFNQIQKSLEVHSCPSCNRLLFSPNA